MKHILLALTSLLLALLSALYAADSPALVEPVNDAVMTMRIPHFQTDAVRLENNTIKEPKP